MAKRVVDFSPSKRCWGHSFQLCSKLDEEGWQWKIAIWCNPLIKKDDILLLGLSHGDTRVAVATDVDVEGIVGVPDMQFVTINLKGATEEYKKLLEQK